MSCHVMLLALPALLPALLLLHVGRAGALWPTMVAIARAKIDHGEVIILTRGLSTTVLT